MKPISTSVSSSKVLTSGPTYPLKEGEGIYRSYSYKDGNTSFNNRLAFSDGRIWEYTNFILPEGQGVLCAVATVPVNQTSNYTLYNTFEYDINYFESYYWLDNKAVLPSYCDMEVGLHNITELEEKCRYTVRILNTYTFYFFKLTANAKEAYQALKLKYVSTDLEYASECKMKSYSEIREIMHNYPQSSSMIIPSIVVVLTLLLLLL